ncbi:surface layer protein [Lasius niger]|uniref:Surface layer protein n=1 Tax=Lasius niger TaxID=67767 RepID=A0A0J7N9G0_LASNI|nr:surface layer protein [Lasius niger]
MARRKTRPTPLHLIAAKRRRTGAQSPSPSGTSQPATEKVTASGASRLTTGARTPALAASPPAPVARTPALAASPPAPVARTPAQAASPPAPVARTPALAVSPPAPAAVTPASGAPRRHHPETAFLSVTLGRLRGRPTDRQPRTSGSVPSRLQYCGKCHR